MPDNGFVIYLNRFKASKYVKKILVCQEIVQNSTFASQNSTEIFFMLKIIRTNFRIKVMFIFEAQNLEIHNKK